MDILKVSQRDMKTVFKDRWILIKVFAVILVPLIYGGIYLAAFWDPYGSTEKIAVAIVNEDVGINNDEGFRSYGKDMVERLKNNDDIGWRFVSNREKAVQDLDDGKYYSIIVIPETFSETIDSVMDGEVKHPEMEYISNDKKNYIISLVDKKAVNTLKSEIDLKIDEVITEELFKSMEELKNGLADASAATSELVDGVGELRNKIPVLSDGVNTLYDGSNKFVDKMSDAVDGSRELYDGVAQIKDIVPDLVDGVNELHDGSKVFKDKIDEVADGTNVINDAIMQLRDKIPDIQDGAGDLKDGATSLKDGLGQINDKLPDLLSGAGDIDSGAGEIREGLKAAAAGSGDLVDAMKLSDEMLEPVVDQLNDQIDEMTQAIGSVATILTTVASMDAPENQLVASSLNSIVSGISEMAGMMDGDIDDELLEEILASSLKDIVSENLEQVGEAIVSVRDVEAQEGVYLLGEESRTLLSQAYAIIYALNDEVEENGDNLNILLVEKINETVLSGIKTLDSGIDDLYDGSKELKDGTEELTESIPDLMDGVDLLYDGSENLQQGIEKFESSVPDINDGITQIYQGTDVLSKGMIKINDAAADLDEGIEELDNSIPDLQNGTDNLYEGTMALTNGMVKLHDASSEIANGAKAINDSIPDLEDGTNQLYDGALQLNDSLTEGANELADRLVMSPKELASFASEPVTLAENPLYSVDNYGIGLTPYFISLALWVGALVMFVIFSFDKGIDLVKRPSSFVIGKYLGFAKIGIIQAVVLSSVILLLGLKPSNIAAFFIFNVFVSLVFIAILQFLIFVLGDVGKLMSMILLILQLTASGGTFPIELVPKFFQKINSYMPFTYTISAMREIISGINIEVLKKDIIILLIVQIVVLSLTSIFYGRKNKIKQSTDKNSEACVA